MRKLIITAALMIFLTACGKSAEHFSEAEPTGSMDLSYAEQFTVDYYGDNSLITIGGTDRYLLVPEKGEAPSDMPADITVIHQPAENIYLAASSAMDLFDGINSLDRVRMTATKFDEWSLPNVREAIERGDILYGGKYSAPDYELILSEGCTLAVESTMIYHCPEVAEQLKSFGIPVLVERSSYEAHPLGRMEWIKLYGLILGKYDEAEQLFAEKSELLEGIKNEEPTGKTAVFFYISANGSVNIRKPGDYVSEMIRLAGGEYLPTSEQVSVDENALSTMNMQFEAFYAIAKEADFIIYNSTVDGGVASIDELVAKNKLLADFKAVREGNVWCTEKNMFQQTTCAADMISDLHSVFTGKADDELEYLVLTTNN
ncbi:MAG: ABC transporter substrate-binding protein [Oscillospiraceae bacterium]